MQNVPLNRLLNQPTVQLKWIEQHKEIEFQVSEKLQNQFLIVWKLISEVRLAEFVKMDAAIEFQLHDHDHLFALLTGADYIRELHPSFAIRLHQPNMVWSI